MLKITKFAKKVRSVDIIIDLMQASSFKLIVEFEFRITQFITGNYGIENSQKMLEITKFAKKVRSLDIIIDLIQVSSFKLIVEFEFRIKHLISGNHGIEKNQKTLKITPRNGFHLTL